MTDDPTMPDLLGNTNAVRTIEPELLLQKLRSDVPILLIDVRPRATRTTGTIKGALWFPLNHLNARLAELRDSHGAQVVILSRTGSRARTAGTLLCLAGFHDVSTLEGGLERWSELGYPLAPTPPSEPALGVTPPPTRS